MSVSYRAYPTSRSRRSKADIDVIKAAIVDVLENDHPMTVRQVFYQLVVRGVIEKTEAQYQGTVIRLMTEMRIGGELPFDWVVDESRRTRITRTFESIQEALAHTARSTAAARWRSLTTTSKSGWRRTPWRVSCGTRRRNTMSP